MASGVLAALFAQQGLELGEHHFVRVEIGGVRRQEQELRSALVHQFDGTLILVEADIVGSAMMVSAACAKGGSTVRRSPSRAAVDNKHPWQIRCIGSHGRLRPD